MSSASGFISVLLAGSIVVLMLAVGLLIACYVAFAIGSMKVLKAQGYQYPWFAWIPILNYFALGQVCDDGNGKVSLFGLEMPTMVFSLWFLLYLVLGEIPNVGEFLQIVTRVIFFGRTCQIIYSKMEGKSENDTAVIGYLSGFFTFIALVKFLLYKKD